MFETDIIFVIHSKIKQILHRFDCLDLIPVYYNLINYVGCKPVLAYLSLCNRLFEKG